VATAIHLAEAVAEEVLERLERQHPVPLVVLVVLV
jgi:hypothetical protein